MTERQRRQRESRWERTQIETEPAGEMDAALGERGGQQRAKVDNGDAADGGWAVTVTGDRRRSREKREL